jgi:hypothetical protein
MGNSNTFSRDVRAAKSNKGVAKPKDKIIGNSSTEDWLDAFDDDLSMMGYRDYSQYRDRSSIDIYTPTGMIDMSETGIPLMANGQYLPPYSGIHNMGTPYVTEERMARYGGGLDKYQTKGEVKPKSRTDVYTDKALYDKAHKAEMDSIMAQGYKDIYKQTWRNLLNAKNESDAIKAADNFKNNYFQKADASPETKALLNQQQRYPVDPEFMEGLIWKTTKEIPWDNVGVSTEDPPRLSPNLYPRVHNIYVPPKPNTQPGPATLKSKPKPRPIEKKKPEVITPEHLPMIEANMPEMRSQEPEITPKFIFPKQSNVNNRIGWRMDFETRKMVPVYLEGKQKVAQGKRLYNKNIPTSTMAIPEDFEPQFDRPEIVEKTDPYWRREYVQPKNAANKKYGGWLDQYAPGGTPGRPPVNRSSFPTGPGRYSSNQGYIDADRVSQNSRWFNPEAAIEEYLGYPQEYGAQAAITSKGPVDNIRHSVASYKTAKAIADKTKPYLGNYFGKAAGVIGANVLGLAHEIQRFPNQMDDVFQGGRPFWNTITENAYDLYNNGFGSLQVFNDMTPGGTTEYLKQQSKKGNLAKGYVEDNHVLPKQERVLNDNTRVVRRDGGALAKFQGDVDGSQVSYLNVPIYKDFNDYYERNKDATTYVDKKITKLYPTGPVNVLDDNYLDFVYQQDNPELNCTQEGCTARANRPIAASFFGDGSSWFQNPETTKKDFGATYSTPRKPTAEEIKKYPYMTGDEDLGSMDAWDILDQASKRYPKNVMFSNVKYAKDYNNDIHAALNDYGSGVKTVDQIWKEYDIPVGSYINMGTSSPDGGHGRPDLIAGSHTVRVVGYAADGEPLIADFGQIRKLSDPNYYRNRVAGIVSVPGKEKYTYKYFKDQEALEKKANKDPYIKDINSENYGEDYKKFHNNIVKEKNYIAAQLGVSPEKYDQYAKIALTLGGTETEFGKGTTYNIPFLDKMGESTGVAQVTESNVADKYKKTLAKYKDDPEAYNAMAALLYVKELDAYKDKWMKSGKKAGERPYVRSDEQSLKNTIRETQGRKQQGYINSDMPLPGAIGKTGQDVFRYTDSNDKAREIKLPYKQFWQSDEDYEKEVNDVLKKEDPTLRFSAKGTKGERTIYKKTKGNTIPENLEDFVYYAWQAPNAVAYGDAQGNSNYYKKAKGIEAKLFGQKLAKKEMGGESGWLDEHDLPKAQPGLQAVSTYPSAKEQNTLSSMPDKRRAYEQNLANEKANREYNAIKGGLNVAGLFYYPASVAASALEFSEGNYGQGAVGLVPFVGPASRANTARNILNQASRNLLTKSYNAGIPYKIAAPIIKGAKKTTMYGANAVNAQDAYDAFTDLDEQRYGGVKKYKGLPKGTTKNLVRGINKLFLPDPKLFGPFGRKVFDPNSKFEDGGWLDEYQTKGEVKPKIDFEGFRRTPSNAFPTSQIEAEEIMANRKRPGYKEPDNTEYYREKAYRNKDQGTFKEYIPQGKISKALEIAANPLPAMKNYIATGQVPDHFSQDAEESMLSPMAIANMGYQGLTGIGNYAGITNAAYNAPIDLKEGNYLSAGLNLLDAIPGIPGAIRNTEGRVKKVLGDEKTKLLKNALETTKNHYDNKFITPLQFKKQIKEIKDLAGKQHEYFQKPEVVEKLKHIGASQETIDILQRPGQIDVSFDSGSGSSYYPGMDLINMDMRQVKRLAKSHGLTPKQVYEHELGHKIQKQIHQGSDAFKEEYDNYLKAKKLYDDYKYVKEMKKKFKGANSSFSKDDLYSLGIVNPIKPTPFSKPTLLDKQAAGMLRIKAKNPKLLTPEEKDILWYYHSEIPDMGVAKIGYDIEHGVERLAHLREMRQAMIESGIIKDASEPITESMIKDFAKKNPKNRIMQVMDPNFETNYKKLSKLFKHLPAAVPAVVGAKALQEEKYGGWLQDYE